MTTSPQVTLQIEDLAAFSSDPLGFVIWAFPWGEPGSELAGEPGPEDWQIAILAKLGAHLQSGAAFDAAFREAVASGHGIGKSALVSWLVLWAISTFEDTRGVVTANTQDQLRTKTWAELAKWYRLFIGRGFFEYSATKIVSVDPDHRDTWRIDAGTWSPTNTEAFAGLHNKGKRIIVIYDEASAIDQIVWDVSNGAFTDARTQRLWFAFGNPTQNGTQFSRCFGEDPRWSGRHIDSRSVRLSDKVELEKTIAYYGVDSDPVRVRVLGQFPLGTSLEFIGLGLIRGAQSRDLQPASEWDPLILGVDVARQGEDDSVLYFRRGLDARSIPPIVLHETNLMTLAGIVVEKAQTHGADAVFVDEGGIGAGLVDRLRQLGLFVQGIQFGSRADLPPREGEGRYKNKRSEMYGSVRRWLATGLLPQPSLGDERSVAARLAKELNGPMFSIDEKDQIALERKRDIKARLGFSPDISDALALTFAYPVFVPRSAMMGHNGGPLLQTDYDPFQLAEVA